MAVPAPDTLSWPLRGVDGQGRWGHARGDDSVREVLLNILLTRPGERLMRPEFGAGLLDFIHQPNNQTTRQLMARVIRKSIEQWEPRIQLEGVEVVPDREKLSEVQVIIRYHMRYTATPREFTLALNLGQLG